MPDALPKKPNYMLNAMQGLASHEEYVTYMEEYLISGTLPKNEFKEPVRLEAPHFLMKEGRLMRRIAEGVTAPYLEWEFRGDLIQRMHEEYGHLSQQGMRDLVRTRAWWPKLDQDVREFVKSCPNCQIAQRQRPGQEREYAQLPTPREIEPFQRWGIDLIGRLPKTKDGNCWIITAIDYATGWPIAKAVKDGTEETVAEFIFQEIYMHFGAPQEIFTDGGKNLWGGVVQKFLKKIKTRHKGTSPYHPRTNGKVESLNGLIGRMLTKYLLGKPTKLWDLYLDQALFACRVRAHATTRTSPYYLVYGKHPRLVSDDNYPLDVDTPVADYRPRIEAVQSARQEATQITYERALREKTLRDERVKLHTVDVGEWVLVRHESPQKFESKWFGPYQIVEKMMLGTYRLHDPNGIELGSLVHGNRLIKANISSADKLRRLWAAPAFKDKLRRQNINAEVAPSDIRQNTELLERFLLEDDTDDIVQPADDLEETSINRPPLSETILRRNQPILRPLLPPEPPIDTVAETTVVQSGEDEEEERPKKMPRLVQNEMAVRRTGRPRVPNKRYR